MYSYLREAILSGSLAPGERLVETSLAERASISRTPVREALQRLEVDGLVRTAGRGVEVTDLSVDELRDLCVAREGMEALAARLAATSRSEVDVTTLKHLMDEMRTAVASGALDKVVATNHSFHDAIWRASRNSYLFRALSELRNMIERMQPTTLDVRERQDQALDEHERLLDAIAIQDADNASAIAADHSRAAMALRLTRG